MKCNTCGAENPEGVTLCLSCGSPMGGRGLPKWVPYAVVAAVAVIALIAFFFVTSSGAGGTAAAPAPSASSESSSAAYLAVKDGKVVIYKSSSAEPYQITDVNVSDLDSDDQAMLDERPHYATVEEAQVKVGELRESAEAAKKEAEERAVKEAEEAARAEAQAQAEAAAAAEAAAKRAYQLPEGGTQPFWGVWIGAFKEVNNAREYVSTATAQGFDAAVYETTDWENLNSDHYYVVSLGQFSSQDEAEAVLPRAQSAGFADAYVKYTGSRK